jgi:transposase
MGHVDDLKTILAEFRQLKAATAETVDIVKRLIRERDELWAEVARLEAEVERLKAQPYNGSVEVQSIVTSASPSPSVSSESTRHEPR